MQYELNIPAMQHIPAGIFRAYDIRGIYEETLTPDIVYQIGLALGTEAKLLGINQFVAARDGRTSGPILLLALQQGLLATGCNVIDIGTVPTPLLYFATLACGIDSGIMLTGSHNPAEYNGLKMVMQGKTLTDEAIQKLYLRIRKQDFIYGRGDLIIDDVNARYSERIIQDIKLKRPLKVVVDCANGVAAVVAPELIRRLGCEVIELFCDIDGDFPNHEPES